MGGRVSEFVGDSFLDARFVLRGGVKVTSFFVDNVVPEDTISMSRGGNVREFLSGGVVELLGCLERVAGVELSSGLRFLLD